MKLKDKIANQIAVKIGPETLIDLKRLELAALRGFERAIELAVFEIKDNSVEIYENYFYTESKSLVPKISNLGEEEVIE